MAHATHNPAPPVARNLDELETFKALPPFAVALYLTEDDLDALQAALDDGQAEHDYRCDDERADRSDVAEWRKAAQLMAGIQHALDSRPLPPLAIRALTGLEELAADGIGLIVPDEPRSQAEIEGDDERRYWSEA